MQASSASVAINERGIPMRSRRLIASLTLAMTQENGGATSVALIHDSVCG
ncbi:MAG: hypothetical protein K2N54_03910 [Helicobacter sp.]|nr:hypothetical protein [Helicobacter sp.]